MRSRAVTELFRNINSASRKSVTVRLFFVLCYSRRSITFVEISYFFFLRSFKDFTIPQRYPVSETVYLSQKNRSSIPACVTRVRVSSRQETEVSATPDPANDFENMWSKTTVHGSSTPRVACANTNRRSDEKEKKEEK